MWLEKRPNADTLKKEFDFLRDDGTVLPLTRITQYMPNGKWKVRIAYCQEDGYPIQASGPIATHIDGKAGGQQKKPIKKGAFAKVATAAMEEHVQHIKAQLTTPSPLWNVIEKQAEPAPDGYVTFKLHTDKGTGKLTPVPVDLDDMLTEYADGSKHGSYCDAECQCGGG